MAAINAQFRSAEFTEYKFHYDLVAPLILETMRQLQKTFKLTVVEDVCNLSDPFAVTTDLIFHGNLTPREGWICLAVQRDFLAMRDQHGNDYRLRGRIEKIEKRLHDLFSSIRKREDQNEDHKLQSPPAQQKEADDEPNRQPLRDPQQPPKQTTAELVTKTCPVKQAESADITAGEDADSEEDFVMVDDPRTLVIEL